MDTRRLEQRIHRLEMVVALALLVASGSLAFAWRSAASQGVERIDARLIRIVDSLGRPRFQIGAPLPNPQVGGKVYPRSRPVPGIMFLDSLGNETGGMGLFDDIEGGGLCFDHPTAEAVCLTKANRLEHIGLSVYQRPAAEARVGQTGSQRVQLALNRGAARLLLNDSQGRPRIRLLVDSTDAARIEVLDERGNVVGSVPRLD